MAPWFLSFLRVSIGGSVAVCAVLILRLLLRSAPRSWVCFLWLLSGLRLVLPFSLESGLSLQPRLELVSKLERMASTAPQGLRFSQAACWIWLAGICLLAGITGLSYLRLRLRLSGALLRPDGCRESEKLETACVLGLLVPRVYLPQGLDAHQRQLIVSHERAHIARGDHLMKALGFCILVLHWFNPLVWLAYPLFCRDIEFACDEHVVRKMDLSQRKLYSTALVNCSARQASAYAVHFSEIGVKDRVLRVLRYRKPTPTQRIVCTVATVFLVVCFLTNPIQLLTAGLMGSEEVSLGGSMQKYGSFPEPVSQVEAPVQVPDAAPQSDPIPEQSAPPSAPAGSVTGPTSTAGTSSGYAPLNKQNVEKVPLP